jgi:hypothetical protein
MGIQNFPAVLQPIIQQGFLEREFQESLRAKLGFRSVADRVPFPNGVGETITKTRAGLLAIPAGPLVPSSNTNFDNGLTTQNWGVEQYTLTINEYAATIDLNTVTEKVGIVSQFAMNASRLGEQAFRKLDTLALNALRDTYMGGNTAVKTTNGSASTAVKVDDIRGFQTTFDATGRVVSVSGSNPLSVTVGADVYSLITVTADGSNVSSAAAQGGISGTLTFSANVTTGDATAGNPVISAIAPTVLRPNGRTTTGALQTGDTLLMVDTILDAASTMRDNVVPDIDGAYNCFLSNRQLQGLFADNDFKTLFRGAYQSEEYRQGSILELMGVRFIPVNNIVPPQNVGGNQVFRAMLCGQGALIEGDFAGQDAEDTDNPLSVKNEADGVTMITRAPMDRLQETIAQSWKWIGGFCVPSDTTANPSVIPTATNSAYKRAIVLESL